VVNTYLLFLILVGMVVLGLLIRYYIPAYLKKKAENLATKEDVKEITKAVESIKHQYATQLFIHQTRYQNEYTLLKDLSEKLIQLRDAVVSLRPPALDSRNANETEKERKQKRLQRYFDAALSFYKLYEASKPFYHEDIYFGIKKLEHLMNKESVEYQNGREFDPQYWEKASVNITEISKEADNVIALIRLRVKYWEDFENHNEQKKSDETGGVKT